MSAVVISQDLAGLGDAQQRPRQGSLCPRSSVARALLRGEQDDPVQVVVDVALHGAIAASARLSRGLAREAGTGRSEVSDLLEVNALLFPTTDDNPWRAHAPPRAPKLHTATRGNATTH